jgi:hypothetical protein
MSLGVACSWAGIHPDRRQPPPLPDREGGGGTVLVLGGATSPSAAFEPYKHPFPLGRARVRKPDIWRHHSILLPRLLFSPAGCYVERWGWYETSHREMAPFFSFATNGNPIARGVLSNFSLPFSAPMLERGLWVKRPLLQAVEGSYVTYIVKLWEGRALSLGLRPQMGC